MIQLVCAVCVLLGQQEASSSNVKPTFDFHYAHQFDTSIDAGGKVGLNQYGFELRLDAPMTDTDDVQFRLQYQQDDWNFSGTTGVGATNPWKTINTLDVAATWFHKHNEKTQWFVGGIAKSSYEDSASMSTVAGGSLGIIHSYSSDVTLGIGLGIISQVLDDARLFPVFVVDWKLSDDWKITSDISTRFGSRTGFELLWTPREEWTLGAGLSYGYSRFKLDDSGFAPNGAGETTSLPLTFRATYHASPSFDLTLFGGVVYGGSLEVTDQSRNIVLDRDYDPAGAVGLFGRIRF
jgi:hypothetical protein